MTLHYDIPLDTEMPIDHYIKMLYRQGEIAIPATAVQQSVEVLRAVFEAAEKAFSAEVYDRAFILFSRATYVYEQGVCPKKADVDREALAKVKRMIAVALDRIETLQSEQLVALHDQFLSEIVVAKEQRRRLIEQSMKPDDKAANRPAAEVEHERRQQELLRKEQEQMAALMGPNAALLGPAVPAAVPVVPTPPSAPPLMAPSGGSTAEEAHNRRQQELLERERKLHGLPDAPAPSTPGQPASPPKTLEEAETRRAAVLNKNEDKLAELRRMLDGALTEPPPPKSPPTPQATHLPTVPATEPTGSPRPPTTPPPAVSAAVPGPPPYTPPGLATASVPVLPPPTDPLPYAVPPSSPPYSTPTQLQPPQQPPHPQQPSHPPQPHPQPSPQQQPPQPPQQQSPPQQSPPQQPTQQQPPRQSPPHPQPPQHPPNQPVLPQPVLPQQAPQHPPPQNLQPQPYRGPMQQNGPPAAAQYPPLAPPTAPSGPGSLPPPQYPASMGLTTQLPPGHLPSQPPPINMPAGVAPGVGYPVRPAHATPPNTPQRSPPHAAAPSPSPSTRSPAALQPQASAAAPRKPIVPSQQDIALRYAQWNYPQRRPPSQPRRGLVNLGNTCYMNSVLQAVYGTALGAYFTTDEYIAAIVDRYTGGGHVANSYTFIVREMGVNVAYPISASHLKKALGKLNDNFAGVSQQDANELLRTFCDALHEDLNVRKHNKSPIVSKQISNTKGSDVSLATQYIEQYALHNDSIVHSLTGFLEKSALTCPLCGTCARSFSPLMSVEVPIPAVASRVSVEECFEAYTKEERLGADSLWECSGCTKKVQAVKQLTFFNTPKVLFVTLKRFRSYGNLSDKVNTPVLFQPTLDMGPFLSTPRVGVRYSLSAVVNHQGNMHGGHYTADVKGREDGCWFNFSDDNVRNVQAPNHSLAYILVYSRE